MEKIKGIAASSGIALGPAFVYRPVAPKFNTYTVEDISTELTRLGEAVAAVEDQLAALEKKTEAAVGSEDAQIFEVHRMFLSDPYFIDEITTIVELERLNVETAVDRVVTQLVSQFQAIEDEYFQQRAVDIKDVGQRLLRQLLGLAERSLAELTKPAIIIAHDLTPSDTAALGEGIALGLCTEIGSTTSHTAILARSLGIPAVVGAESLPIKSGTMLIVDGDAGELLMAPEANTIAAYQKRQAEQERARQEALAQAGQPAITRDGRQVEVVANIGSLAEARRALQTGAEGVGLLRTEFLFLQRETLPSEEEQYQIYRAIADIFQQRPLIIRTLDVGGDKELPSIDLPPEQNPFLGRRAIRLCLAQPELFQTQLRAILRAGVERNLKIMFPLISSVGELRQAKDQLEQAKNALAAEGIPFAADLETGIMIEVPSAAVLADVFAPLVDFFSIGTNDLAQYTLAVDRTNQLVAHLADPLHPAVIRLIRQVIEAAHTHGKWVGLCGEMAGDSLAIPLLLGLGLDEFSMTSAAIPPAKLQLRQLSSAETAEIARHCLTLSDLESVRAYLSK